MRKSYQGGPVSSVSSQHALVEPLESRQMLSASLVKGVIKVSGSAGDDAIIVGLKGTKQIRVTQGGASKLFARSKVKSISINTGDGNDTINVGNGIKQWVNINGGNGNDEVHGGNGREVINGGAGDDTLFGGDGSDWIAGGDGGDLIEGDGGNDYLYGDAGDDNINGGTGNDVMAGDSENTLVTSGLAPTNVGNDFLNGGDGNDWLIGDRHVESLSPYTLAGNGLDTYTGGAGKDILDVGGDGDIITDKTSVDYVPSEDTTHAMDPGPVHTHVLLKIQVKKGSRFRNIAIPSNIGFMPTFLALLHTHEPQSDMPPGTIHFESPGQPSYKLIDFFKIWGISLDSGAVGRFLAPAGKKVTMTVTRGSTSTLNAKLGNYVPRGSGSTNVAHAGGDVITLKVG